MDILMNSQYNVKSSCSAVACACFGDYYNCPYDGCPNYNCNNYSFCDTKGGGNPCIVKVNL